MRLTDETKTDLIEAARKAGLTTHSVLPPHAWRAAEQDLTLRGRPFVAVLAVGPDRQPAEAHLFSADAPTGKREDGVRIARLTPDDASWRLRIWLAGRSEDEVVAHRLGRPSPAAQTEARR